MAQRPVAALSSGNMSSIPIRFPNAKGQSLAALLDMPHSPPTAWALLAHCFTCSKDFKAMYAISDALIDNGIAVLRFDFTGLGQSEGELADTNFSTNVADLVAAARYLAEQHQAPHLLVGHSLGGAAVLRAAAEIPSARAIVTIAAPSTPRHLMRHLDTHREELESRGEAEISIGGRSFRITRQLLDDIRQTEMTPAIRDLGRALLVLHSPADEVVSIDHATEIFTTARHPKSFVSLDTADHLLSNRDDGFWVGRLIATWVWRYLDDESVTAGPEAQSTEDREPG